MASKVVREHGNLMIEIDGKTFPPLSFKSFRPNRNNVSGFYQAGIRLFNILTSGITSAIGVPYSLFGESWVGINKYDFSPIDAQIEFFLRNAPDAYFSLMIQLDTRDWWLEQNPGYPNSFHRLAQMETDPKWREAAADYMQAVICHVEEKYQGRFYAYFLLCGTTTEWFSDYSHEEPSIRMEEDYARYCRNKRQTVPSAYERETDADQVFLNSPENDNLIRYREFESVQRANTVLYYARKAQEILQHNKLIGVYFGYLLELEGARLWETGALDYERIFLSKDIDLFASPVSYAYRGVQTGCQQMLMNATLEKHNKLFFLEHDHTTSIVPNVIEGHTFAHPGKVDNLRDDIDLMRRSFMLAMANRTAFWWFDMLGGWFSHARFMKEITHMIQLTNELYRHKRESISEIAIIGDPKAMYCVNKNSNLNDMLFGRQRGEWSHIGAPYDLFSACDYDGLDEKKYKLIIFLDPFCHTEKISALLSRIKQKEEKTCVVFTYANPICEDSVLLVDHGLHDSVVLPDHSCFQLLRRIMCYRVVGVKDALANYPDNSIAIGSKTIGACRLVYSGVPTISRKILIELADWCGVHRYVKTNDAIVYAASDMIGVYRITEGNVAIHLKEDGTYYEVFTNQLVTSADRIIKIDERKQRSSMLIKQKGKNRIK